MFWPWNWLLWSHVLRINVFHFTSLLAGQTTGSLLLLTFCNKREPALQDGKPIENDLIHFFYRTRTMQIPTRKRFVFCNIFLNISRDGSDVSIRLSWTIKHRFLLNWELVLTFLPSVWLSLISLLLSSLCFGGTNYLFIYFRICTISTGAKTIGHKSPPRFKNQPNPLLKFKLNNINKLNRLLNKCTQ